MDLAEQTGAPSLMVEAMVPVSDDPPATPPARCPNPADDPAGFLRFHGWTPDDDGFWPDPLAHFGTPSQQVVAGYETNDKGEKKPIMQTVVGALPWRYLLTDAVDLQRVRNEPPKKAK